MDFFEKLGKTLNDATEVIDNKTKEISTVTKLNSQIAQQDKLQSDMYKKIGKMYFDAHNEAGDFDPEYAEAIESIRESMIKEAELKAELNVAKGIAICPSCKAENPITSAFCGSCGASLPGKVETQAEEKAE